MSGPGPDHGVVAIVQTLLNYCFAFYALILIKVASMFSVSNRKIYCHKGSLCPPPCAPCLPLPDVDQAPGVRCQSEVFRPGQLRGLRVLMTT